MVIDSCAQVFLGYLLRMKLSCGRRSFPEEDEAMKFGKVFDGGSVVLWAPTERHRWGGLLRWRCLAVAVELRCEVTRVVLMVQIFTRVQSPRRVDKQCRLSLVWTFGRFSFFWALVFFCCSPLCLWAFCMVLVVYGLGPFGLVPFL